PSRISCTSTQDVRVTGNPSWPLANHDRPVHGIKTLLLPLLLNASALAGCAQVHFQQRSPGPDPAAAGFHPASSQQLEDILRASPAAILHEPLHMQDALLAIYQKHQFRPLWASDRQVKQAVAALGGA